MSGVTAERDRLAAVISGHAGSTGLGLGAYIRDRVDAIRGADDDRSRVQKMKKLDSKIKEVKSTNQWHKFNAADLDICLPTSSKKLSRVPMRP